jgi:phosphohistidine phosphatase SixA
MFFSVALLHSAVTQLRDVLQQRFPHFDAVVSSDLLRTVQTAQVLAGAYNLQVQQQTLKQTIWIETSYVWVQSPTYIITGGVSQLTQAQRSTYAT